MSQQDSEIWIEEYESIRSQLVEMYLSVKVRSSEEMKEFKKDVLQEERDAFSETSVQDLITYI